MSSRLGIGTVLVASLLVAGCGSAPPEFKDGTLVGRWNTVLTLVDGSQNKLEVWQITEENGVYTLTTAAGSITGTPQAGGSILFYYEGSDPRVSAWGVNNLLQIEIRCSPSVDGAMIGTVVDRLYVANGLGILDPIPTTESWRFRATRA